MIVFLYSKSCPTPVTIGGALNFRLDGGQTHFRWAKNHPIPSRKAPAKMPRKGGFIPSLMLQKSIRLFQRLWYSRYSFTFTGVSNTSPGDWPWDFWSINSRSPMTSGKQIAESHPQAVWNSNLSLLPSCRWSSAASAAVCALKAVETDFDRTFPHAPCTGYLPCSTYGICLPTVHYICHTTLYSMVNVDKYHGASRLKRKSESCGWSGFRPPNWMKEVHQHWLRGGWADQILNHRMVDPSSTQVTVEKRNNTMLF